MTRGLLIARFLVPGTPSTSTALRRALSTALLTLFSMSYRSATRLPSTPKESAQGRPSGSTGRWGGWRISSVSRRSRQDHPTRERTLPSNHRAASGVRGFRGPFLRCPKGALHVRCAMWARRRLSRLSRLGERRSGFLLIAAGLRTGRIPIRISKGTSSRRRGRAFPRKACSSGPDRSCGAIFLSFWIPRRRFD
jgi:hypothetical protein